jgi:hypothetical protein
MSLGPRVILTAMVLVLGSLVVFSLRPSQTRRVGTWMWRGGANDRMRLMIFTSEGLPRRYAWLVAALWFGLFLLLLWVLPIGK